eukprot:TRINITY_DN1890_c0_g1_i2.p1 TRINITY_DN1890_c0_g1~~TRINITY_DN1890_c0_g1_i2.p1  ORF type:complete len:375 (+),score=82.46 TRINITY_DN1890_c0_g1_i2:78-1202(+)
MGGFRLFKKKKEPKYAFMTVNPKSIEQRSSDQIDLIIQLKSENNRHIEEIAIQKEELALLEDENAKLKLKCSSQTGEIETLRKVTENLRDNFIKEAGREEQKFHEQLAGKEATIATLWDEVRNREEEVKTLRIQLQQHQQQLSTATAAVKDAQLQQKQLQPQVDAIEEINHVKQSMRGEMDYMRQMITELQKQMLEMSLRTFSHEIQSIRNSTNLPYISVPTKSPSPLPTLSSIYSTTSSGSIGDSPSGTPYETADDSMDSADDIKSPNSGNSRRNRKNRNKSRPSSTVIATPITPPTNVHNPHNTNTVFKTGKHTTRPPLPSQAAFQLPQFNTPNHQIPSAHTRGSGNMGGLPHIPAFNSAQNRRRSITLSDR